MVSWNYRMGFDKFQEGFAKLRDSSTALHVDFSWYGMPFSKATWVVSTIRGSWRSWAPGTMLSKLFEHIMVRSCLSTTTLVSFCGLMKSFHWTNYYRFIENWTRITENQRQMVKQSSQISTIDVSPRYESFVEIVSVCIELYIQTLKNWGAFALNQSSPVAKVLASQADGLEFNSPSSYKSLF